MGDPTPFWIDYDYDRGGDSRGSRFGTYLQDRAPGFEEEWSYAEPVGEPGGAAHLTASYAAKVWSVATGPVMSPGYIQYHGRISGASLYRSSYDGALRAQVSLFTDPCEPLRRLSHGSFRDPATAWWPWDKTLFGWQSPDEGQRQRTMLTVTHLDLTLPLDRLPVPTVRPVDSREAARIATRLVELMNAAVGPVIEALDQG